MYYYFMSMKFCLCNIGILMVVLETHSNYSQLFARNKVWRLQTWLGVMAELL